MGTVKACITRRLRGGRALRNAPKIDVEVAVPENLIVASLLPVILPGESGLVVGQNIRLGPLSLVSRYPQRLSISASVSSTRPEAPNRAQRRIPSTNQRPISTGTT